MDNNLNVSINLQDNISGNLAKINNNLGKFSNDITKINNQTSQIGAKGGLFKQMLGANLVSNSVMGAIDALKSLGSAIFGAYTNSETYLTKLTGFLNGNREAAEAHAKELQNLAKQTPFNLQDLQASDSLLLAYGFRLDEITDKIKVFGDVAAGVAKPGQGPDLSGIIAVMGQIKGKGKADTRDLYQFAERGIPIFDELAKATGHSVAEIQKMTEKGMIGEKEVLAAFKNMGSEGGKFYKAMELQSKTVMGRISNISDTLYQGFAEIGKKLEPVFNIALQLASSVTDAIMAGGLDKFIDGIKSLSTVFIQILEPVLKVLSPILGIIGQQFQFAATAVKMVWDSLSVLLIPVFDELSKLFNKNGNFMQKIFNVSLNALGKILKVVSIALEPFIAILSGLIKLSGVIIDKINEIGNVFIDMLNKILKSLGMAEIKNEKPKQDLKDLMPGWKPAFMKEAKQLKVDAGLTNTNNSSNKIDTMASQQPKIVNVNILSGSGASLIQNLDVKNMVDKSTGRLTDEFKREMESYFLDLISQGATNLY